MIWQNWYNQQLRPELGSHQSNIGILQKTCEGPWVAQIIAIGLNLGKKKPPLRLQERQCGKLRTWVSTCCNVYTEESFWNSFIPRHRSNGSKTSTEIDQNIEYWTFMKKCNTLPARMANRADPHNWQTKFYLITSTTFNDNSNAAHCKWPELPSEASLLRTPAGPHCRSRILRNQLAVSSHFKNVSMWFVHADWVIVIYVFVVLAVHNSRPYVVTRACETAHWHVKRIGAWSPGLAPHPGEASPGNGQIGPNH